MLIFLGIAVFVVIVAAVVILSVSNHNNKD